MIRGSVTVLCEVVVVTVVDAVLVLVLVLDFINLESTFLQPPSP